MTGLRPNVHAAATTEQRRAGFRPVFTRVNERGDQHLGDAQRRDCVYVDDVVEALLAATLRRPSVAFNVGNVIDHLLAEIARHYRGNGQHGRLRPVPGHDHQRIDIGSFHTDGTTSPRWWKAPPRWISASARPRPSIVVTRGTCRRPESTRAAVCLEIRESSGTNRGERQFPDGG